MIAACAAAVIIPGIVYAIRGVDSSTRPYVGDQPGDFTPAFLGITFGWLVIAGTAFLVIRRFRRRAATVPRPQAQAA